MDSWRKWILPSLFKGFKFSQWSRFDINRRKRAQPGSIFDINHQKRAQQGRSRVKEAHLRHQWTHNWHASLFLVHVFSNVHASLLTTVFRSPYFNSSRNSSDGYNFSHSLIINNIWELHSFVYEQQKDKKNCVKDPYGQSNPIKQN